MNIPIKLLNWLNNLIDRLQQGFRIFATPDNMSDIYRMVRALTMQKMMPDQRKIISDHIKITFDHVKIISDRLKIIPDHWKIISDHIKIIPDHMKIISDHAKIIFDHTRNIFDPHKIIPDHGIIVFDRVKIIPDHGEIIYARPGRVYEAQYVTLNLTVRKYRNRHTGKICLNFTKRQILSGI